MSERFINGEKEAREEAQGLLKRIDEIDYEEMSPRQKIAFDIEKQLGNET